ncbi:pilus assembly PilX family protein [Shewanella cyperi]|uniref:pilus assembly PilX family protein n=1 Tax=Shewanella cyperi TaxID=2814292 RepID=UPI001A93F6DE|nr:pilus assembly PilX N-terminal domain-containing protein [Shewanella cyperi]QSX41648.1 pilus assembly PilX N-terminal domain-containing protein [Shewanella cyperi]
MKRERGMVLFFALVVLVIMTVIGVALAMNSSQSLRMAGAGAERIEAFIFAQGFQDKVINDNRGANLANLSADGLKATVNDSEGDDLRSTAVITPLPTPAVGGIVKDVSCQRSSRASGANLISCKRAEINTTTTFGRKGLGQLTVVSGIEQQVLTGN